MHISLFRMVVPSIIINIPIVVHSIISNISIVIIIIIIIIVTITPSLSAVFHFPFYRFGVMLALFTFPVSGLPF